MATIDYTKDNIKILDSIDFTPYFKYIKYGDDVWNFFNAIENDFNNTELTNTDILEGDIFNWLSFSEMIEYFENRYPNKFRIVELVKYVFGK